MPFYEFLGVLALSGVGALAQNTYSGDSNCPGVLNNEVTCCVGGTLVLSVCSGWPICEGPTTTTQSSISCVTIIPASDTAALSSASASISASGVGLYKTAIPAGNIFEAGSSSVASSTSSSFSSESFTSTTSTSSSTKGTSAGAQGTSTSSVQSSSPSTGGAVMATLLPGAAGAAMLGLAVLL